MTIAYKVRGMRTHAALGGLSHDTTRCVRLGSKASSSHRAGLKPCLLGRSDLYAEGIRGRNISCKAEPRRIARLEKQFAREMSNLLCYDETLLNAMNPFREYTLEEDYLLAEVTDVVLSSDLQVAKVFVYFSGDDPDSRMFAFENLQRKTGYIRKELSQKVKMRRAPEVRLIYDKSLEEQEKLDELFADMQRNRASDEEFSEEFEM